MRQKNLSRGDSTEIYSFWDFSFSWLYFETMSIVTFKFMFNVALFRPAVCKRNIDSARAEQDFPLIIFECATLLASFDDMARQLIWYYVNLGGNWFTNSNEMNLPTFTVRHRLQVRMISLPRRDFCRFVKNIVVACSKNPDRLSIRKSHIYPSVAIFTYYTSLYNIHTRGQSERKICAEIAMLLANNLHI